jgi:hypothetical protein
MVTMITSVPLHQYRYHLRGNRGMPNPAGLGAMAATLNYIPIIGPARSRPFAILVGSAQRAFLSTIGAGSSRTGGL